MCDMLCSMKLNLLVTKYRYKILNCTAGALASYTIWPWYANIPYKVFDISCAGSEDKLLDCQYSTTSSSSCGGGDHANVFCQKGICTYTK